MPTEVTPFDAAMRHQFMLERVKGFYALEFNSLLIKLETELRAVLRDRGNLGSLNRTELRALLSDLERRQAPMWQAWRDKVLGHAERLSGVERQHAARILAATMPDAPSAAYLLARAQGADALWAFIRSEPMEAGGVSLVDALDNFVNYAKTKIAAQLVSGYAGSLEAKVVLANVIGNKDGNSGLFRTLRANARANIATVFQHVSNNAQASVQKVLESKYRWVSVLDDRTTAICRHRHGKIFEYGKGPVPPAHPNCRSKIVPASSPKSQQEEISNADEWLAQQLASTVVSMLGVRLNDTRMAISSAHLRPLSITDFARSSDIMTGKN